MRNQSIEFNEYKILVGPIDNPQYKRVNKYIKVFKNGHCIYEMKNTDFFPRLSASIFILSLNKNLEESSLGNAMMYCESYGLYLELAYLIKIYIMENND